MKRFFWILILPLMILLNPVMAVDCLADTAFFVDMDTTSETYGEEIPTGLCACLGFESELTGSSDAITLTVLVNNNEPLRAFQFEIIDDTDDALLFNSVVAGDKIEGWSIPATETENGDVLVFGFSFSGAETDIGEGVLVYVTFDVVGNVGDQVTFWLGGEGGVRLSDGEAENVTCSYPDADAPVTFNMLGVDAAFGGIPTEIALLQNYPNPFNPVTTIDFQLVESSPVELVIYNVLGQKVAILVNREISAGYHHIQWDGRNEFGKAMASGVYFYSLKTDGFFDQKKMLLLQ